MSKLHTPVMVSQVLDFLNLKPGMNVIDATIGTGGHTEKILERISPGGHLFGIDKDKESLDITRLRLQKYSSMLDLIHGNFCNIDSILRNLNIKTVDAILFDLGLSSHQLETPERGFSIKYEGPLDMRMDRESYISAYDLVNNLTKEELAIIIRDFGQERWHYRIAEKLVYTRKKNPVATTIQLSKIVLDAIPYRKGYWRIHPATRTFQALRIAVNRELEALSEGLTKAVNLINKKGRIVAISFHSLEDRIVKNIFRNFARENKLKIITKKPLKADKEEMLQNPRSRSACLRVAEVIG